MADEELFGPIPPGWKYKTLGAACAEGGGDIQTGPFGSQLHAADYVAVGIPSIMPQNIGDNRLHEEGIARITAEDAQRLSRYLVRTGDIVYSRRGDVERRALVRAHEDGWLCGTGCLRVRLGEKGADPQFVSYYLGHPGVREWIVRHAHGATMPNLNTSILSACPFLEPPIEEQRAIAHILGTLDDKIELNRRANETLEAMARALFKAWFVDFEPVRAKQESRWHIGQSLPGLPAHLYDMFPDQLVESELGEIPVGWKLGAIEDLCSSISSGGTPARKKPLYWSNGTIPWFKTGELNDGPLLDADEKINEAALAGSSCKLWPAGTILFALYASPTVGRIGILTTPGTSNQAAAGLMAKDSFGIPFLRRVLIEAREKLQSVAVGAAQQNINQAILKSHQIILPASELAKEYSRIVSSWDDQQVEIAREIRSLNLLRDTLLHKLISGELRIPDAERIVGAAV